MIVDTHTHASPLWMEPIETLRFQMAANKVGKALLLPLRDDFDLRYIIECTQRYPGQFHTVAAVDHNRTDAPKVLAALVTEGAVAVRLNVEDRSPGSDPLAIWSAAAELDLPVSALGTPERFLTPAFARIIEAFPRTPMVMEHLGGVGPHWGPGRPDKSIPMDLYKGILSLARYPNVYMKVPGLAEFMPRPRPMTNPALPRAEPLWEMALDAFGASRLMWGSDFPPVANREGYANALNYPRNVVKFKNESDKDWVFGKTAMTVFGLGH